MSIKIDVMAHNLTVVEVGPLRIWFSYSTPIAFQFDGQERVVSENLWTAVTGRHLNTVGGSTKDAINKRLPRDDFEKLLGQHTDKIRPWSAPLSDDDIEAMEVPLLDD